MQHPMGMSHDDWQNEVGIGVLATFALRLTSGTYKFVITGEDDSTGRTMLSIRWYKSSMT
jgi:hypothetical protein